MTVDERILHVSVGSAVGKSGYQRNKYKFGRSFHIKELTLAQLIYTLTVRGFPITAPHARLEPRSKAKKRDVKTFRHTENFLMSGCPLGFLMLDDDGHAIDDSLEFWKNDPFFNKYGSFLYETASSTAAKRKVRPCFVFEDFTITTDLAMTDMVRGFYDFYGGRIDKLSDVIRVFYGVPDARTYFVGKTLPQSVYQERILNPYMDGKAMEETLIDKEKALRHAKGRQRTIGIRDTFARSIIEGRLNWLVKKCEAFGAGDSRNSMLYWAGRYVAGGMDSSWTMQHSDLFYDIEDRIANAFMANGYGTEYGGAKEISRVYGRGVATGGDTWQEPEPTESWFLYEVGEWVISTDGFTGKILERKRPFNGNNHQYPAYLIEGNDTIYPETMLNLTAELKDLSEVHPPLLATQTSQLEVIISGKEVAAYNRGLKDGYELAGYPFPVEIAEMMNFGREKGFNEDTGEIIEHLSLPLTFGGITVNVEYTKPGGYRSYKTETDTPVWLIEAVEDSGGNIVVPHTTAAVLAYMTALKDNSGRLHQVYGLPDCQVLPQSLDFDNVIAMSWPGMEFDPEVLKMWYGRNVWELKLPVPIDKIPHSHSNALFNNLKNKVCW